MSILDRLLRREELIVATNPQGEPSPGQIIEADGEHYRVTRTKALVTPPEATINVYGVKVP